MDFGWSQEETMWRKAVRDFAQKKIAPRVREIDEQGIPQDMLDGMTEMGLWAPTVSEKYGGSGLSVTMATIAAEELGRADISLALPVMYLGQASWGQGSSVTLRRNSRLRFCQPSQGASCFSASPRPSRAAGRTSRA